MIPSILDSSEAIRKGQVSPVALLEQCLDRIDHYDSSIRAWVLVDRDGARRTAEEREREIKQGSWRGPLHGIPVGIKDIIDVFDWPTAAGSKRWAQSFARRDAIVVERLRRGGAVLVGKTVTTQYASFDPSPTRNPWNLERTPGGSSSGSAAAVAYGGCLGALGSQTGGSITRPAAYCGVAGCKPTFGRVPTEGLLPLAVSMDHPGPIAGSVADLAILLQAIGGPDPRDLRCSTKPMPDLLTPLRETGCPPRLGRLRGLFETRAEPCMVDLMNAVVSRFCQQGATVTDVPLPASFAEVLSRHRTVMAVEAAAFHRDRLERYPDDYDQQIRGLLEEGLACPAPEYARCKEHQEQLRREIGLCFQEVTALLSPATTGPAPAAVTTGDPAFNSPWSYTGLPTVSFATGVEEPGLPLALQVIGSHFEESQLFQVARWCESLVSLGRREPRSP